MTDQLPTAAEALAEAVKIARDVTLALTMAERGKLWVAIAHEIREAADARAQREMWRPENYAGEPAAARIERLKIDNEVTGAERKASPEPEAPTPREPVPANVDERLRVLRRPADLRFGGVSSKRMTKAESIGAGQLVPEQDWAAATWTVGDVADCVHCHTPIVFVARRMKDPVGQSEGDFSALWVHKYTDQRTCMTPTTGDTMVDLDATAVHTFATPPILGIKG